MSKTFCDTLDNFGDTQKCRDTQFENHCTGLSNHRCTRVENPGEGVPDVFAKIP
jgi:hypothetical protein